MLRAGVMMLALAFALGPWAAHAQDASGGMLGLPLVVKEGGWARYSVLSEDDLPVEVVFKVGAAESHQGKPGRWIVLETNMPEVGRVVMEFLVGNGRFAVSNVMRMRVRMPGQPAQEGPAKAETANPPMPKLLKKGMEQVAGKMLEVTEYGYADGTAAGWSPVVPVLGLTRVSGPHIEPIQLVAYGVGGDPWKGSTVQPIWPLDAPRPPQPAQQQQPAPPQQPAPQKTPQPQKAP